MLSFAEEIVLLLLDDEKGQFVDMPLSSIDVVIAGAALMDPALHNRIDTDLQRLTVTDQTPTGDDILDHALGLLAKAGDGLTVSAAVEEIATYGERYKQQALDRLVARGILRQEEGRFLWVFHTRRYPVIDDQEQREVKSRLRQILLSDEIPDPRDVVLICLIDACSLFDLMLTADEMKAAAPRIEQLRKMDLIGQAVAKAVAEIEFIIRHNTAAIH